MLRRRERYFFLEKVPKVHDDYIVPTDVGELKYAWDDVLFSVSTVLCHDGFAVTPKSDFDL
jgi:hypothetical protein